MCIFSYTLIIWNLKNRLLSLFGFPKLLFKIIHKSLKEKMDKGNNSAHFNLKNLRKSILYSDMRNVMPKLQSGRLNGVAIIEKTYIHAYKHHAKLR